MRGELTDTWECTPHSGTTQCNGGTGGYYYHVIAGFWANRALNTLSSNISVPTQTYGADGMGRVSKVSAGSGQNPVTSTSYNLSAYTYGVTFGSKDSDSFTLDSHTGRMTNYTFTMGTKTDSGTTTWNANGSLATLAISDQITGTSDTQTCNYTHDDLARIASVNCGSAWAQTFSMDPFGNLSKSGSISFQPIYTGTSMAPGTTPTNQYYQIPGGATGASNYYDVDGRVTNDLSHTYTWDAESKIVTLDTTTLTHDALGRMVEKGVGSTYTQFVFAPMGNMFATMNGQNLQNAYVPLPAGTAVYNSSGLAYYRHRDHLGSSRLSTTPSRTMYSSTAYAPYGESYAQAGTTDLSFTGQDQYTTAGTYDFLARKFNPVQGRWLTPDPSGTAAVDPTSPQSWNRYAYVLNNPMSLIDPLGLDCVYVYDDGSTYVQTGDCNSPTDNGYYVDGTVTGGYYDPTLGNLFVNYNPTDPTDPGSTLFQDTATSYLPGPDNYSMPMNDGTGAGSGQYYSPGYGYVQYQIANVERPFSCAGQALKKNGVSIALDVVGAIPGLGNAVSGSVAAGKVIDKAIGYGSAGYGVATGFEDDPGGVAFSGTGLGLTLADAAFEGGKIIPVLGNILSVFSGAYDIHSAYKTYQRCMAGN